MKYILIIALTVMVYSASGFTAHYRHIAPDSIPADSCTNEGYTNCETCVGPMGNGGYVNTTPRYPNDLGGLSGWRTLEIAKMKHPKETKFYLLSVTLLEIRGLNAYEDNPVTGHWTIRRMSEIEMQEWAATREIVMHDKSQAHPFTRAVRAAIINKVSRDGTSKSTSNNDR